MDKFKKFEFVCIAVILSLGFAVAGYFIGQTMYNAKVALNVAQVKGLAERQVKANTANWTITFRVTGKNESEIPSLYEKAEKDQKTIVDLLQMNGLDQDEIGLGVIEYRRDEFRDNHNRLTDVNHVLTGTIYVETKKVDLVSKVRSKVNKLMVKGIDLSTYSPSYLFTDLNAIKPGMLKEATQNARIAANEFAQNAGASVGNIRNAHQGSFVVRDAGSDYGNTAKINKTVRVVTTITFYLK